MPTKAIAAMAALTHHGSKLSSNSRPSFFLGIRRTLLDGSSRAVTRVAGGGRIRPACPFLMPGVASATGVMADRFSRLSEPRRAQGQTQGAKPLVARGTGEHDDGRGGDPRRLFLSLEESGKCSGRHGGAQDKEGFTDHARRVAFPVLIARKERTIRAGPLHDWLSGLDGDPVVPEAFSIFGRCHFAWCVMIVSRYSYRCAWLAMERFSAENLPSRPGRSSPFVLRAVWQGQTDRRPRCGRMRPSSHLPAR